MACRLTSPISWPRIWASWATAHDVVSESVLSSRLPVSDVVTDTVSGHTVATKSVRNAALAGFSTRSMQLMAAGE